MLSKNNSSPEICARNLLKITRGEVPYERSKGISLSTDKSATVAAPSAALDAEIVLSEYEPRINVESVDIVPDDTGNGVFTMIANIRK